MKNARGITLIALIITIVVLLIISVVTINAVSGEKLIEHANNAAAAYEAAAREENAMIRDIVSGMYDYAAQANHGPISDYGIYFNREYRYNDMTKHQGNDYEILVFHENGSISGIRYEEYEWNEGEEHGLKDFTKTMNYATTDNLEYNHPYTGTGLMGESYIGTVDNNGNLTTIVEFPNGSATYSENTVILAENITGTFSNEGQTLTYGGKTFTLQ